MDQWNIQGLFEERHQVTRFMILDRFALGNKARQNTFLLYSYKLQTPRNLVRQMVPNYTLSVPTGLYRGIVRVKCLA